MADQLLVRCYNVGLGDCIYLRVPDGGKTRHLLIDCGNKYSGAEALHGALVHLERELPELADGRRQLDLLVVTHPHEDHVRGIDVETFRNLAVRELWMSDGMNPDHPQKETLDEMRGFAEETLTRLRDEAPGFALRDLADSLFALSKADAMDALFEGLPELNEGLATRYVHADTPAADLDLFDDPEIRLHVLAPMHDIDRYYLGRVRDELRAFRGARAAGGGEPDAGAALAGGGVPANISRGDFERLRARMLDNALAFVLKQGHLINNLSVVLLLEWHGRRLLFTGDAEVQLSRGGRFEDGKRNGSWNVMWEKRRDLLDGPVDFLKVGHHGSHNATPWTVKTVRRGGEEVPHPVNAILDALLPVPAPGGAPRGHAVVSTRRTTGYETIPDPALLIELGRRVANAERYREPAVKGHFVPHDAVQPWRTDLRGGPFVELKFKRA